MGRRRRRGKRRSSAKPVQPKTFTNFGGDIGAAMADQRAKQRAASSAKEAASKRAQQALNKSQQAEGKAMQSSVAGKYQNQAQQTGSAPSMRTRRDKGGSSPTTPTDALAQGLQGAPRPGRGRGKGSRPIAQTAGGREMGGGFRNKAFGMGREQRGFGMGRTNMEEQMGNRAFGMGRDQRGMGMGREGMMRGRGYGSVAGERAKGGSKPTSGVRSQGTRPAVMGGRPSRGYAPNHRGGGMVQMASPAMAPQVRQAPQTSSFNPSTGRMEFASTPNNFSRGSQTMRMPFRKSMKSQGGFKLPPKSQIQK